MELVTQALTHCERKCNFNNQKDWDSIFINLIVDLSVYNVRIETETDYSPPPVWTRERGEWGRGGGSRDHLDSHITFNLKNT